MKRVLKGNEPATLSQFRKACPSATWDQMRDDALHGGQNACKACRDQAIKNQHGLCAYCECKISPEQPTHCRVEHFHPKSDISTSHNWALDWQNMLATCDGGEKEGSDATPLPANLSCDVSKKARTIAINPLKLPAFPNIFVFDKGTGHLAPDPTACAATAPPINADELKKTIEILNLNCERLARQRRQIVVNIDRNKKVLREKKYNPQTAQTAQTAQTLLIKRYFNTKWPEFFTTIHCCLGKAAEDHLSSINYNG